MGTDGGMGLVRPSRVGGEGSGVWEWAAGQLSQCGAGAGGLRVRRWGCGGWLDSRGNTLWTGLIAHACYSDVALQVGVDNVAVHNLSPGMVWTDLLLSVCDTPMSRFGVNCLGEWALS